MKKSYYKLNPFCFSLLLMILSIISCGKENELLPVKEEIPVSFSSVLLESDITRAVGTTWESDDRIGVFGIAHQSTLTAENIIDNNENIPFITTSGNGFFYAQEKKIYYPEEASPMDIIAYYPYKTDLTGYSYPIDITEHPEFFYSNNLKGIHKEFVENNGLQFKRVLSKIIFSISPEKSDDSLDGLKVSIEGATTKALFSLVDGSFTIDPQSKETFDMVVTGDHAAKKASAILIPGTEKNELTAHFKVGGKSYRWIIPHTLEAGKVYRYDIKLEGTLPVVTPSLFAYMEIPVYAENGGAPNSIMRSHLVDNINWLNLDYVSGTSMARNYTLLFDTNNRVPYWVAYPMHPAYMKSGNRTDRWAFDPGIDDELQPVLFKGWNSKNLNRGHLLASADRSASIAINETTFYFTNMAPQDRNMNSGPWAKLEDKVRAWSKDNKYDTLYVVTGCILPKSPEPYVYVLDNINKKSTVPKYLYKALLKKNKNSENYSSIVFKMENADTGISYDNAKNIISVSELEQETGFTFFPLLPKEVAASVKSNKSLTPDWN